MTKSAYTAAGQALQQQHDSSPTEVIKAHKSFFDARMAQIERWVTDGVRADALVRFLLMDLSKNDKLRACTRESLYLGLLACATTGLEPGALKQEAFLIPYGGVATFVVGYRGLIKQARRSREIVGFTANLIRDKDEFDLDLGTANRLVHKPARGDRGDISGAYAIATMAHGGHEIEFLDLDDLKKIQRTAEAKGKSPAWRDWGDQMMRKAPVRRLAKRLPLGHSYFVGLALDHAADDGTSQKQVLDLETDGEASRIASAPSPTVEQKTVGEVDSFDHTDIQDEDR